MEGAGSIPVRSIACTLKVRAYKLCFSFRARTTRTGLFCEVSDEKDDIR